MERSAKRLLYWAPRILCMLFAAFTSVFALDVFDEGRGFWPTALALAMHLIPTFLVIAVLVVSWRHEWLGGTLYLALAALYVVWAWGKPFFGWIIALAIPAPLVLIAALFLFDWRHRAELRAGA